MHSSLGLLLLEKATGLVELIPDGDKLGRLHSFWNYCFLVEATNAADVKTFLVCSHGLTQLRRTRI